MKIFTDFIDTFPNQFTAWLVILSTLFYGYITGLNISRVILDKPHPTVPPVTNDTGSSVTVSIPAAHFEITQPPKLVYKEVKQANP